MWIRTSLVVAVVSCASVERDEPHPDGGVAELTTLAQGSDAPTPISIPHVLDDDWELMVAYTSDVRINGVACGELDVDRPGDEIATVDRLGRLRVHRRSGDGFEEVELPRIPVVGGDAAGAAAGELVQVAVGDLAPSIPGDEIVAVGMAEGGEDDGGPGAIRVYARSGKNGGWVEHRFVAPALVHAIAIDDFIADRPGNEILAAGFFGEALLGQLDVIGGNATLSVRGAGLVHEGNAKGACATARGFVLACDDGSLVQYHATDGGGFELYDSLELDEPLARVAYHAPLDRIAVCGNGGTYRLIDRDVDAGHTGSNMLDRSDNRLRGAVIADLDPSQPSLEAATAGYDGRIRVIFLHEYASKAARPDAGPVITTSKETIARDTAKIHHLTTGRFEGLGDGRTPSLVSCGYSGDVLVLSRRE